MAEQAIEIILTDYVDAIRRKDIKTLRDRLDPAVVHRGVAEHLICRNRGEVIANVRARIEHGYRRITRLELTEAGDRVVMYVEGPEFTEVGGVPLDGGISVVFTLREGKIVEMQDYRSRGDALAAVGVE